MDKLKIQNAIDSMYYQINTCPEGENKETLKFAIELLGRWIPKKVIYQGWYAPVLCPTCRAWLSEHLGDGYFTHYDYLEYCHNDDCHQALDWSEAHKLDF